jgi:hypothetical protein
MKKKIPIVLFISLFFFGFASVVSASAQSLSQRLSGKILLQVENHGEAWYVDPINHTKYYLGKPDDMLSVMRERGIGISNVDLQKIPVGNINGTALQESISQVDYAFAAKNKGKIFLQVEAHGEAWYLNPGDNKRYYLGNPISALVLVRHFGLGIKNADLETIESAPQISSELVRLVYDGINQERVKNGLEPLKWNEDLAFVAYGHSMALADENLKLTGIGYSCEFPFIHHEGLISGLYHSERLNKSGIYYFEKSAENIALVPRADIIVEFSNKNQAKAVIDNCAAKQGQLPGYQVFKGDDSQIISAVEAELTKREESFKQEKSLNVQNISWYSSPKISVSMVKGWMNSPGHRANILNSDYNETGIGLSEVNGYLIGTQIFIKRAACGFQTGVCCEKKGYYPYCFKGLGCLSSICYAQ